MAILPPLPKLDTKYIAQDIAQQSIGGECTTPDDGDLVWCTADGGVPSVNAYTEAFFYQRSKVLGENDANRLSQKKWASSTLAALSKHMYEFSSAIAALQKHIVDQSAIALVQGSQHPQHAPFTECTTMQLRQVTRMLVHKAIAFGRDIQAFDIPKIRFDELAKPAVFDQLVTKHGKYFGQFLIAVAAVQQTLAKYCKREPQFTTAQLDALGDGFVLLLQKYPHSVTPKALAIIMAFEQRIEHPELRELLYGNGEQPALSHIQNALADYRLSESPDYDTATRDIFMLALERGHPAAVALVSAVCTSASYRSDGGLDASTNEAVWRFINGTNAAQVMPHLQADAEAARRAIRCHLPMVLREVTEHTVALIQFLTIGQYDRGGWVWGSVLTNLATLETEYRASIPPDVDQVWKPLDLPAYARFVANQTAGLYIDTQFGGTPDNTPMTSFLQRWIEGYGVEGDTLPPPVKALEAMAVLIQEPCRDTSSALHVMKRILDDARHAVYVAMVMEETLGKMRNATPEQFAPGDWLFITPVKDGTPVAHADALKDLTAQFTSVQRSVPSQKSISVFGTKFFANDLPVHVLTQYVLKAKEPQGRVLALHIADLLSNLQELFRESPTVRVYDSFSAIVLGQPQDPDVVPSMIMKLQDFANQNLYANQRHHPLDLLTQIVVRDGQHAEAAWNAFDSLRPWRSSIDVTVLADALLTMGTTRHAHTLDAVTKLLSYAKVEQLTQFDITALAQQYQMKPAALPLLVKLGSPPIANVDAQTFCVDRFVAGDAALLPTMQEYMEQPAYTAHQSRIINAAAGFVDTAENGALGWSVLDAACSTAESAGSGVWSIMEAFASRDDGSAVAARAQRNILDSNGTPSSEQFAAIQTIDAVLADQVGWPETSADRYDPLLPVALTTLHGASLETLSAELQAYDDQVARLAAEEAAAAEAEQALAALQEQANATGESPVISSAAASGQSIGERSASSGTYGTFGSAPHGGAGRGVLAQSSGSTGSASADVIATIAPLDVAERIVAVAAAAAASAISVPQLIALVDAAETAIAEHAQAHPKDAANTMRALMQLLPLVPGPVVDAFENLCWNDDVPLSVIETGTHLLRAAQPAVLAGVRDSACHAESDDRAAALCRVLGDDL